MVICLELGADLHMAQLMPLPLTVSCFIKIQIGFTFLTPAHPGSPGKRAVKRVCVCVMNIKTANKYYFYHFKHFKKKYSLPKLHSNYESYQYSIMLQTTVTQCMSQPDNQTRSLSLELGYCSRSLVVYLRIATNIYEY